MQQFEWIHAAWLAIAIVLEIIANVSFEVFRRLPAARFTASCPGGSIGAFSALSVAVKGTISVAYALGGFVSRQTIAAGWVPFGQRLNNKGWRGLSCW